MYFLRVIGVLALLGALSACVQPRTDLGDIDPELAEREALIQRKMYLEASDQTNLRLGEIAHPMWVAAAPLCNKRIAPAFGIHFANQYLVEDEWRGAARELYALADPIQVLYLTPGSAAERDGLQVGDILTAVDGLEVATGEDAMETFSKQLDSIKKGLMAEIAVDDGQILESVVFTITRSGDRQDIAVRPEIACAYGYYVVFDDALNAYADGRDIAIHQGMMRFALDDTELATVVSHELAHNLMGHIEAKMANAAGGLLLDLLLAGAGVNTQGAFSKVAASAYSEGFEAEADHVGLYIMTLAGYEIDDAPYFWRRMAIEHPTGIDFGGLHPTTPERFLGLERAVAEIRQNQADGVDLIAEINIPDLGAFSEKWKREAPTSGEGKGKGASRETEADDEEGEESDSAVVEGGGGEAD
jgi:hypothetical protein